MRYSLFWEFTKRLSVSSYRRFGKTHQSHIQGSYLHRAGSLEVRKVARLLATSRRGVKGEHCAGTTKYSPSVSKTFAETSTK